MRDPERITEVLEELERVWRKNPDWRLGQVIGNVIRPSNDPFYIEDDKMLARLKKL